MHNPIIWTQIDSTRAIEIRQLDDVLCSAAQRCRKENADFRHWTHRSPPTGAGLDVQEDENMV
jgi:hypothetical protein